MLIDIPIGFGSWLPGWRGEGSTATESIKIIIKGEKAQ